MDICDPEDFRDGPRAQWTDEGVEVLVRCGKHQGRGEEGSRAWEWPERAPGDTEWEVWKGWIRRKEVKEELLGDFMWNCETATENSGDWKLSESKKLEVSEIVLAGRRPEERCSHLHLSWGWPILGRPGTLLSAPLQHWWIGAEFSHPGRKSHCASDRLPGRDLLPRESSRAF